MSIKHFFLPHPQTHKKAHLISWYGILSYVLIFILLQTFLSLVAAVKPGVLGINSNVEVRELIELTNQERQKKGLNPLEEDERLTIAAREKGLNMFEEDYWAHYSPSGKDPWGFINGAGYKFSVAGENLAKNFYTSEEVVKAWMASPTHRDNLLNSRYQDIGIAVVDGVLNGQRTVLVVQEFGTESGAKIAASGTDESLRRVASSENNLAGVSIQSPQFVVDPYLMTKVLGFSVLALIGALVVVDVYVLKKRAVYRLSARHLPQMAMITLAGGALISINPGAIL